MIIGTARERVMAGESPLSTQVSLGARPAQAPPLTSALRTLARSSEFCHRCSRVTGFQKSVLSLLSILQEKPASQLEAEWQ